MSDQVVTVAPQVLEAFKETLKRHPDVTASFHHNTKSRHVNGDLPKAAEVYLFTSTRFLRDLADAIDKKAA